MEKSKEIFTKSKKQTKTSLIWLYKDLEQRLGSQPTKMQWIEDAKTPSDMPVRMLFGNWNNLVREAGGKPYKPYLSKIAQENRDKAHKGKRSFAWKGGKIKDKFGYVLIWKPEHPNAKIAGYIHEHRLVMSNHLGRPLSSEEFVHHRNAIKDDNRLENLEVMTKRVHRGVVECPHCKNKFTIR